MLMVMTHNYYHQQKGIPAIMMDRLHLFSLILALHTHIHSYSDSGQGFGVLLKDMSPSSPPPRTQAAAALINRDVQYDC